MSRVIVDMAMSLDGFAAGSDGRYLYPVSDMRGTPSFKALVRQTGAVAMDRTCYEMAQGDFTGFEYQVPVFIFTDSKLNLARGENDKLRFNFVTSTVEETISKAKAAARSRNVMVVGWTGFAQECVHRKLADELIVRVLPVLLGQGTRLLEHLGDAGARLAPIDVELVSNRCDLRFWLGK